MTTKYIWRKGQRYYLYECYDTWKRAIEAAQYFKKKYKSSYFIHIIEKGTWFPEKKYCLYLNKYMKLW